MYGEHNPYATLTRRQVALFERNPVCGLCYRICMDMCEEYGGINFDLLDSIRTADDLCGQIIQNAWSLDGVEHYFDMVNNRLGHSKPAIACTFATVCVTLTCLDNLPEPVYQLALDMRGLIIGEGNDLYDSLRQSAYRQDIVIDATAYGEPPPEPSLVHEYEQACQRAAELEQELTYYKTQLKMKNEEQKCKPNFTIENHGKLTFIAEQNNDVHDNHGCNIYLTPQEKETGEGVNDFGNDGVEKSFEHERDKNDACPSAEQILGIPHEGKYTEVRQYIDERCRFDEEFKQFVTNNTRVALCQRLSKEFGWTVDHYALGRNINRKRKR